MVDTLVSGASASRRVGSTPISGTTKKSSAEAELFLLFFDHYLSCKGLFLIADRSLYIRRDQISMLL